MEYTKGEWKAHLTLPDDQVWVLNKDSAKILASIHSKECPNETEREANAHLIAAAPDMYEALSQLRNDSQWAKLRPNTREAIIKALAKAEE